MRIFTMLLSVCLCSGLCNAQYFEGKIVYELNYQTDNNAMSNQQWQTSLGSKQVYVIKGGNYKSSVNGVLVDWELYVNSENRVYQKLGESEVAFWSDAAANPDSIYSIDINKKAAKILDYKCDEITMKTSSGVQKLYFNKSLKVDPALYENHHYGNWSAYLKAAGALPLKMIVITEDLTIESTAIEVLEMAIDDSELTLPEGMPIQESPF